MIKFQERMMWTIITGFLLGLSSLPYFKKESKPANKASELSFQKEVYQKLLALNLDYIKKYYLYAKDISPDKLFLKSLEGLYQGLGDEHTAFLDPVFFHEINQDIEGKQGGVGLYLTEINDQFKVIHILKNSPADLAHIQVGDSILKINQVNTDTLSLDQVIELLKGRIGSNVTAKIYRENTHKAFKAILKRSLITIPSVYSEWIKPHLAYIKIIEFTEHTAIEFQNQITNMSADNINSIILDLRDNPGGLLSSAISIADMFLSKGIIVSTQTKNKQNNEYFYASNEVQLVNDDIQTIIIVNEETASAAEILAASLHDHHKATLVGETTFGKGSIQTIFPFFLKDQEIGAKITTAHYITPSGKSIDHIGIKPDIEISTPLIDSLSKEKVNFILKHQILIPFIRNSLTKPIPDSVLNKIKTVLKEKELSLPPSILQHVIAEQKKLLTGQIYKVDQCFDRQLTVALSLL